MGESQEIEVELVFSKDATSEIQDTAPTVSSRASRRKGVMGIKLSGGNAMFRGEETRVVH